MESRLRYSDSDYLGFSKIPNDHAVMKPSDQIVIVFVEGNLEPWLVDCEEGIANLKQAYLDYYEQTVEVLVLDQHLPTWIVIAEFQVGSGSSYEESTESETRDSCFGPLYSLQEATGFMANLKNEPGFLGASVAPLEKP